METNKELNTPSVEEANFENWLFNEATNSTFVNSAWDAWQARAALSQRSEAVPAPSDEMVIRGAEVLHDSLRHAGCTYDFDHSLKGTEIQQEIAEAVFNAMIEVRHQNAAPAPSAAAGELTRVQQENKEFFEWWVSSGQQRDHDLKTENAAHATWQERARRAAQPSSAAAGEQVPEQKSLFDRKLADLEQRGHEVIGRILYKEGEYALFDGSCRWLTPPQYQRLMHEQDGSLFAQSTPAQGDAVPVAVDEADLECHIPPFGWRCTRGAGHSGSCAAVECPEDVAAVERGMKRLADATHQSSADAVDAARYRWLRASHEAIDSYEDDEGNPLSEINPVGFTVFKPGKYVQLEPISCSEGELDATLDAAIAAQGGKGGAA